MAQLPQTRVSLLARLQRLDDASAWSEFLQLYGPAVFGYFRRRGLQEADAVDLTQEVFRTLVGHMARFEYQRDKGSFRSWLFTVVSRQFLKFREKTSRQPMADDLPLDSLPAVERDPDWDTAVRQRLFQVALQQVKSEVSTNTFEAFRLTAMEGLSGEETAQKLGISRAAVYLARGRVLSRLQAIVVELEVEDDR